MLIDAGMKRIWPYWKTISQRF